VGVEDVVLEHAVAIRLSATSVAATVRRAKDTARSSPTGRTCSNGGIGAHSANQNFLRARVESPVACSTL
jgi:hypothetical protein